MTGAPRLPTVPAVRLALPLWPGRARPAWRRPTALGLALLALAALAGLLVRGRIGQPPTGAATGLLGSAVTPRADPETVDLAGSRARLPAAPRAAETSPAASDRVVAATHAAALFAQHSWYVTPPPRPPPPPAPEPPPPQPTAPPFPYTLVGSLAPQGRPPVFFLARGDRVIDAHVGDRLDGVYQLESATGGQLVFVYLPLNVRHNLAAGAPR